MLIQGLILNADLLPDGDLPVRMLVLKVEFKDKPLAETISEEGPFEYLFKKYHFKILNPIVLSVKTLINRTAWFEEINGNYVFVRFGEL